MLPNVLPIVLKFYRGQVMSTITLIDYNIFFRVTSAIFVKNYDLFSFHQYFVLVSCRHLQSVA